MREIQGESDRRRAGVFHRGGVGGPATSSASVEAGDYRDTRSGSAELDHIEMVAWSAVGRRAVLLELFLEYGGEYDRAPAAAWDVGSVGFSWRRMRSAGRDNGHWGGAVGHGAFNDITGSD